jgi:hypothetical protein
VRTEPDKLLKGVEVGDAEELPNVAFDVGSDIVAVPLHRIRSAGVDGWKGTAKEGILK